MTIIASNWLPSSECQIISNKSHILPRPARPETEYIINFGWQGGYEFRQFLGNVYKFLDELASLHGIQQLCHHYYLQNGSLNARMTADRIKKFVGKK